MKTSYFHAFCGCSLLLASACAVGPNHEAPKVATAENHRGDKPKPAPASADKEEPAATLADLPWWEVFRDPTLFALIKESTDKAYDLRIAWARVEVARQSHRAASWALAPTIGVAGGVGQSVGTPTVPGVYPAQTSTGNYGLGVGASWEPDIWGRLRRTTEVQLHNFHSRDEDRRGVYIALVGDVAELYFRLLSLDLQKSYANQAVKTREDTYVFFQQRAQGGVGNELEVARALASWKQAEAALTQVDLAITNAENALSFLLARLPGPIERKTKLDEVAAPPAIPTGLPSTLLQRRPDIRSAEHELAAANAQVGVEKADFFPKFELTAFLGVVSPDLTQADVIRGGAGVFSWTLPFLGGERVRAEYDAAKATWKGVTAQYERVAVNSFREVADALVAIETLKRRRLATQEQVVALENAEKIAQDRYRGGVANYLDVLTTQEGMLGVQLELAEVKGLQQIAVARLYRTLGGGWPLSEEQLDRDERDLE